MFTVERWPAVGPDWGDCDGEAVPGVEGCALPGDEDCDGTAVVWSGVFRSSPIRGTREAPSSRLR